MTAILGISAFYHNSAAVIVRDGEIVAAAQEERFTGRQSGFYALPPGRYSCILVTRIGRMYGACGHQTDG